MLVDITKPSSKPKRKSVDRMKIANMSVKEYGDFYNLGELRRKLKFLDLDRLNLKYLDSLRDELDDRLLEYSKKEATNETGYTPR